MDHSFTTGRLMDTSWIFFFFFAIADVAASVDVHFENKDGGFFLKHSPRQYYSSSSRQETMTPISSTVTASPPGSVLSIDKFTVFQTSEPVSVRATYGPFSTKQTVPARYIVPDPLDTLPLPDPRNRGPNNNNNTTTSSLAMSRALLDAQELGTRHLDMSAHLVSNTVARDSPVLRVLFHAGSESTGRRQLLLGRHQRVCVVLHASLNGGSSRLSSTGSKDSSSSSSSSSTSSSSTSKNGPLTAACSPDGEDGVCLAQITIPANWWPPLPPPDASGRIKVPKTLPRIVQLSYSVLEPRSNEDGGVPHVLDSGSSSFCQPRVQIQPVTPLGSVTLAPNREDYKELKTDEYLTLLVPHGPLYPRSRLHVPAFLHSHSSRQGAQGRPPVAAVVLRARVKSDVKILDATSSNPDWIVESKINMKNTAATFTARRKENVSRLPNASAEEIMTMLLEASDEGAGGNWDGGRIVWSVRYAFEGEEDNVSIPGMYQLSQQQQQQHHHHHHVERGKVQARLEIQKDDIQAVLPISKNWEVMNTAVLTGRQVSQAMKVFIVSQAGKVADVTLQSSCHSEDESVLKVSSSCSSVYVDGSEIRGSSNASVLVKYGTYTGLARFTVWMPEFPLEVTVSDSRLNQIKSWKVPEEHLISKNKRSLNETSTGNNDDKDSRTTIVRKRSSNLATESSDLESDDDVVDEETDDDGDLDDDDDDEEEDDDGSLRFRGHKWDEINAIDRNPSANCRLRFQQSPVEIHARFFAADHDSGRVSYFVNRRTWLRITDLVLSMLRVSDPRIATLSQGKIVQGRSIGRAEVQVISPITGRVIGAKEVRVGNDRVAVSKLSVKVVSGLQLTINPDSTIENGYIAETSVTRKLTAQYQEGLLDIDVEFSDGFRTPLREIAVSDYHLVVESLDPEVVAFAPMVASHHPRVIAVGEGRGDLLKVTLHLADSCRLSGRKSKTPATRGTPSLPLATSTANIEVDFATSDLPNRPEFVQNDGGTLGGSSHHRERKNGKDGAPDLNDILIGGMGGVGIRHQGGPQMTPMEIGLYVLLAAFCFAIVVFVVSCVVYTSKFKPQSADSPLPGLPGLGAARAAANQLAQNRRPRESTTNAHDWVWLGRATLERAGTGPQQVRVTSNPLAGENNPLTDAATAELGTSFDNPNHIELPSVVRATPSAPIDTTTYCKRDKMPYSFIKKSMDGQSTKPVIVPTAPTANALAQNNNDDVPPPLPPHGILPPSALTSTSDDANGNDDYKPPVPPHRNTGVLARLPETPRKRHHRTASASHNGNYRHHDKHHDNKHHDVKHHDKHNQKHEKHHDRHHHHHNEKHVKNYRSKNSTSNATKDNNELAFVELRNNDEKRIKCTKSREVKRATVIGNPMFSSSSSSSSCSSNHEQEEAVPMDDLNLGMDYNQIMQYFDNLKESNA
ncbi:transmembrane protein 132E isoform X2 [Leptopilina boulardi]|uniref:transmembrane protein 132E isoform X2 n=1 Tax=Leptopilina boulardi TaxID=63433 RepID=UPI0021F518F7|nr:transmembrane protein 132E isoform X2 [Leptopilina boulardi]